MSTVTVEKPRLRRALIDSEYYPHAKVRGWVCSFAGMEGFDWSAEGAYVKLLKAIDSDKETKAWVQRHRRRLASEGREKWAAMHSEPLSEPKPADPAAWWKPGTRWLS